MKNKFATGQILFYLNKYPKCKLDENFDPHQIYPPDLMIRQT